MQSSASPTRLQVTDFYYSIGEGHGDEITSHAL